MKQILHVDVNNYDIEISDNKIEKLLEDIDVVTRGQRKLFVISKKVFNLYNSVLNLKKEDVLILPDGEKEKNIHSYLKIIEKAIEIGLTRHDVMVAIGGGVIGDITGFAASTYMRGIDYIQVPTTLLAMVDSSVGGKTAIDIKGAKNLIGTFHQPKAVFININFLKTLDKKQFISGIGEILKYAFIENSCACSQPMYVFEYLSLCFEKLFEKDTVTIIRTIDYCLKLKIAVVNFDEKEASLRKILNFGHTLGHALEVITRFKKYTHGEAVVYGMFFALELAYKKDMISYSYYRLSKELLEKYKFKSIKLSKFDKNKLINIMKHDKKALSEDIVFMLPSGKKVVKEVCINPTELIKLIG